MKSVDELFKPLTIKDFKKKIRKFISDNLTDILIVEKIFNNFDSIKAISHDNEEMINKAEEVVKTQSTAFILRNCCQNLIRYFTRDFEYLSQLYQTKIFIAVGLVTLCEIIYFPILMFEEKSKQNVKYEWNTTLSNEFNDIFNLYKEVVMYILKNINSPDLFNNMDPILYKMKKIQNKYNLTGIEYMHIKNADKQN